MNLIRSRQGNVALITALLIPLVLGFAGGAVDFYRWNNERTQIKALADALATRGAREFLLANASDYSIKAVINNVLDSGYAANYGIAAVTPDINVDIVNAEVSVRLVTEPTNGLILTNFMPFMANHDIRSIAVALGGMNVCVVALEGAAQGAVAATMNSKLLADKCSIMSNSTSPKGIVSSGMSEIQAGLICSAGGVSGGSQNYSQAPTLDCPAYLDPLAERKPPAIGMCTDYDAAYGEKIDEVIAAAAATVGNEIKGAAKDLTGGKVRGMKHGTGHSETTYTLNPRVYCGGLMIGAMANVKLNPGNYIIKDGPLLVGLGGKLTGENVGFYLAGDDATFYFGPKAVINLTAPKEGPLAGILFFEERNAPANRVHRILSDDARTLLGTFYLSRGALSVASLLPVADQSAYTAIVANKLWLEGSPTLTLNANYSATEIPVPAGVGPVGSTVSLRE